jgi:hypothetical protein
MKDVYLIRAAFYPEGNWQMKQFIRTIADSFGLKANDGLSGLNLNLHT